MKARFYNAAGHLVWECTKDAKFELTNGTKAMKKGATRGELLDQEGRVIDEAVFAPSLPQFSFSTAKGYATL